MEKLQWFKFTPGDWMMGKIQRCPEITQARFLRLCCLYWNKECDLSKDDAIIEIDEDHFKCLESKKIISCIDNQINISFLDEQFFEIQEVKHGKSKGGVIGNLKRWHPAIYAKFKDKKISLEDAIKESQTIADQSHTDGIPIADQSQNIAEKRREDKIRLDKIREDKKKNNIPEFEEFKQYAISKKDDVDLIALNFKYESWKENGWKNGNGKKIKNWKSTLLNTLPYLKEKSCAKKESNNFSISQIEV